MSELNELLALDKDTLAIMLTATRDIAKEERTQLQEALKQRDMLREALGFYADTDNLLCITEDDRGDNARAALAATQPKESTENE